VLTKVINLTGAQTAVVRTVLARRFPDFVVKTTGTNVTLNGTPPEALALVVQCSDELSEAEGKDSSNVKILGRLRGKLEDAVTSHRGETVHVKKLSNGTDAPDVPAVMAGIQVEETVEHVKGKATNTPAKRTPEPANGRVHPYLSGLAGQPKVTMGTHYTAFAYLAEHANTDDARAYWRERVAALK